MKGIHLVVLGIFLLHLSYAEIRVSLNSNTWKVSNQNGSLQTAGRVPGGIYTDLQAGGILKEDLFYRFNDIEYRWVSKENWTYSRTFDLTPEVLGKKVINLVLYGVDTVAEIVVNGQTLGSVDNMFVRYIFPITSIAKANNTLEVRFTSPVTEALRRANAQPYPILPECVAELQSGECHANLLRKMQASFSWDWGPAFPSVGLWKSVEVEAFNLGVVREFLIEPKMTTENGSTTWSVNVTYYADLAQPREPVIEVCSLFVVDSEEPIAQVVKRNYKKSKFLADGDNKFIGNCEFDRSESDVDLWWPNGFGDQPMYEITVSMVFLIEGEDEEPTKATKFGFRTVELVQEPLQDNVEGLSFYFKINGVPIFAKGSNWIPGHIIPELGADPTAIRHLLQSAKDANMNMLRVWGGGVYESDVFYEIADELGIMIWQDMMFACAMYQSDDDFLANVRNEVEQQVRRLQPHPSVVVWAGNNENEAALIGNWYGTNTNTSLYKNDYVKLYVNTIKPTIEATDPTRPFAVSSPSNGIKSEEDGGISDNPYSPVYGDVHYYNYVSDGWESFNFPDTRFASEYGYQSLPSFVSLKKVSNETDWSITSDFSDKRQHHGGGNMEMTNLINKHLPLAGDNSSVDYFQTFIYYSQITQAMSTKTESEKYRRDRSKFLTDSNKGHTMGALYWQLNDVWEAPTWASIELSGRWKMLHYFAVKFFAPVLVSFDVTVSKDVNIYVISDLLEDISGVQLEVMVHNFSSFEPLSVTTTNLTVANATSVSVVSSTVNKLLGDCPPTSCFLHARLVDVSTGMPLEGAAENIYFPESFANVDSMKSSNVTVTIKSATNTSALLEVRSSAIAPFVWLETEAAGTFSDNGFTTLEPLVNIEFRSRGDQLDINSLVDTLTVKALNSAERPAIGPPFIETNEVWLTD